MLEILLIALALAMDCFTVSIASGVLVRRGSAAPMLRMAFLFGLFQALMPLLGWCGISLLQGWIEAVDHWIAFGLLLYLGLKMIRDAFRPVEQRQFDPTRLSTQLTLALATSIDALAIGITFGCTGYERATQLLLPTSIIGVVSLLMSLLGWGIGRRFGSLAQTKFSPELAGGLILIGIGIKILAEHLIS